MRLDARPVIDQLTDDMGGAEVQERLFDLEQAIGDAVFYLQTEAFKEADWEVWAPTVGAELLGAFGRFDATLNGFLARVEESE